MARATTGVLMGGMTGKAGTVVFVRGASGSTYLRPRVRPRDPQTPAQEQVRRYMAEAMRVWRSLTVEQARAWDRYAESLGGDAPRRAVTAFTGLALKFQQAGAPGPIPVLPPEQDFTGDGIGVAVDSPFSGVLRFMATGPNAAGVVTELLVQRVSSLHNKPTPRAFRPAAFVGFESGSLSHEVALRPGYYACAVRFVKASTGQVSGLVGLGSVAVG